MMLTTALLISGIGLFARTQFASPRQGEARAPSVFWTLLLATWGGLNAVFLGGDLFNLYVALELLTFAAVPLVSLDGRAETLAAALRYLLFALPGSILYLLGGVLLYGAYGTLDIVLLSSRIQALGLGGFPLTGGALAKLAVKAQLGEGIVGTFATLSAAGSALLMLHFLRRLIQSTPGQPLNAASTTGYIWPWLTIAVASLAVPWALYPATINVSLLQALAPGTLWAALWPTLIGAVLFTALWRWRDRLPRVPQGDLVVVGGTAVRGIASWGEAIERTDGYLRRWPVATLSLIILVITLFATMLAWG
ncbi:MAG: hypothetical protein JO358_02285 [Alphaproteobacteria bacterium]|nr:hypothetical protein [Alphaproteobacteria bacterium]